MRQPHQHPRGLELVETEHNCKGLKPKWKMISYLSSKLSIMNMQISTTYTRCFHFDLDVLLATILNRMRRNDQWQSQALPGHHAVGLWAEPCSQFQTSEPRCTLFQNHHKPGGKNKFKRCRRTQSPHRSWEFEDVQTTHFKIDLSDFKSLVSKGMCWISRERNRNLKTFLHPQYLGLTLNSPHQMLGVIHETLGLISMGSSHFEAAGWSA